MLSYCVQPSGVLVERSLRRGLASAKLRVLKLYFMCPIAGTLIMFVQANFLVSIRRQPLNRTAEHPSQPAGSD